MNASKQQIDAIFFTALQMPDDAQRKAFLDRACAEDPELAAAVTKLLSNHAATEDFFASNSPAPNLTAEDFQAAVDESLIEECSALDEKIGSRIGRYKLLHRVGEGGWGVVYMAEQEKPIHRRVAVKIIKMGMDNESVVARFQTECQALALMDHPSIARVLDAGSTLTGRPYFVMELVNGVKITDYCEQNNLSIRDRILLFVQICQAVQHAHHKGIVHRDIKPSNILVAVHDGVPMPKIIDFGIARAIEAHFEGKATSGPPELIIGTPAYMSPEQAGLGGLDVDTRSDVYSLGVLLCELITGRTPLGPLPVDGNTEQIYRALREYEPKPPSQILVQLPEADLRTIGKTRQIESSSLIAALEGDLDSIVMKALEKDRTRRYETADALAKDLVRYLKEEPVSARAPDRLYRFEKLVRRNKVTFAAASLVLLILIVALGLVTQFLAREKEARRDQVQLRQEAEIARANEARLRQKAEIREKITRIGAFLSHNHLNEADAVYSQIPLAEIEPTTESLAVLHTLGSFYACSGRWRQSADCFLEVVRENQTRPNDQTSERMDFLFAGPALIECGDMAAYERLRLDVLERYVNRTNFNAAEQILKGELLSPADENICRQLAPLAGYLERSLARTNPQSDREGWQWRALALALYEYRCGHFTNTLDWARKGLNSPDPNLARVSTIRSLAAMSYHELGQSAEATAELGEARKLVEKQFSQPQQPTTATSGSWAAWVISRRIEIEAQTLIEGGLETEEFVPDLPVTPRP